MVRSPGVEGVLRLPAPLSVAPRRSCVVSIAFFDPSPERPTAARDEVEGASDDLHALADEEGDAPDEVEALGGGSRGARRQLEALGEEARSASGELQALRNEVQDALDEVQALPRPVLGAPGELQALPNEARDVPVEREAHRNEVEDAPDALGALRDEAKAASDEPHAVPDEAHAPRARGRANRGRLRGRARIQCPPMIKASAVLLAFGGVLTLSACGAGEAVRPKDPTYASATGGQAGGGAICHDVKADGAPLIVDWRPEDRGDLEVAMKQGVAFVHYDCNSIKLLPDCHADGVYGFIGTTRKEQVISLKNADEAKANLPFNGGTLGAGIGANSSLDIGLVMVGKRATTFADVTAQDMKGKCDGATHFVRGATLGAYAMQTDTAGSVSAAGQLFGIGASGGSSSEKGASNKDGDLDACKQADPDAPKPPPQCAALLRVQLVAVGGSPADGGGGNSIACPAGLIASNGKCAPPADDAAKKCHDGDAASCATSCKAGVVESCDQWGGLMIEKAESEKSTAYDAPMVEAFQRACDLKNEVNCAMLAINYASGRGVPRDGAKALDLATKACADGAAIGCTVVAGMYDRGMGVPADRAKGTKLYERACNAGDSLGCIAAAQAYMEGRPGIAVDLPKMADYFDRACDAGEAWGCVNAGKAYEQGNGVPANPTLALGFYRRGCQKKNADACTAQKRLQPGQ
jgi:hypothetical protein